MLREQPAAPKCTAELMELAQECLSEAGQECLEALAGAAVALSLRDVSSSAMVVAARAAAAAAQAAQDEEERAYDLARQLEAQVAAAAALLDRLGDTLAALDRGAARAGVEAAAARGKAGEEAAKVERYRAQQAQQAQRLEVLGYSEQLSHGRLRALGQRHAQLCAELTGAEGAVRRYEGLPADMGAARVVHLERLGELERLRARLAEGLAGL